MEFFHSKKVDRRRCNKTTCCKGNAYEQIKAMLQPIPEERLDEFVENEAKNICEGVRILPYLSLETGIEVVRKLLEEYESLRGGKK